MEAEPELRVAVVEHVHHASSTRQGGANQEGQHDRPVDVHAHQSRGVSVHCRCAHRSPCPRAGDEELEHGHKNQRSGNNEEVQDRNAALAHHERPADRDDLGDANDRWSKGKLNNVLDDEAHANGSDQRGESRRASQWSIRKTFNHNTGKAHECCGDREHDDESYGKLGDAFDRPAPSKQRLNGEHGNECRGHIDITVGKVDELNDPVDHGVAEGDEGINRSERERIKELVKPEDEEGGGEEEGNNQRKARGASAWHGSGRLCCAHRPLLSVESPVSVRR